MKGWINVDAFNWPNTDHICDLPKDRLPFEDNSVDEIYCGHMMEHVSLLDTPAVMAEFKRVLKPRGKLTMVVPDYRKAAAMYLKGETNLDYFWYRIILGYDNEEDSKRDGWKNFDVGNKDLASPAVPMPHRNAYDADHLYAIAIEANMVGVVEVDIETCPYLLARSPDQVGVSCYKPDGGKIDGAS